MSEPFLAQSVLYGQDHAQFLERLTDEAFWEFATACAHVTPAQQVQTEEYVICRIGGSVECLIALADLHAVVSSPPRFSLLPAAPDWMLGVTAWAGRLLAAIDLGAYLTQSPASPSPYSTMLLTQHEHILLGLATSITGTVAHLDKARIDALPEQAEDDCSVPCAGAFAGIYNKDQSENIGEREAMPLLVLNVPVILTDIVKRLQATATYG